MSLLTVRCKLIPNANTAEKLTRTVNQFANACNFALQVARERDVWNKFALQKAVYGELRETFGLSANLAIRAIARVGKRKGHKVGGFKATSVDYDQRIFSINLETEVVSLTTAEGRVKIPLHIAGYQRHLLKTAKSIQGGQLVQGKDSWYIHIACEFENPPKTTPKGHLGVDLGIVNIATDSDGEAHSGKHLNSVRHRHRRLRRKLQKKGTKGAKRRLKKLSGKERRFSDHTNQAISKMLVAKAQRTGGGIALEDLEGIRNRVRLRKPQRATLHSWSFHDLGQKILYKAEWVGVEVSFVDPHNTSRTCPACGHCEKLNRVTQAKFVCKSCGLVGPADYFAACNIARRADVAQPYLGEANPVSLHGSVPDSPVL